MQIRNLFQCSAVIVFAAASIAPGVAQQYKTDIPPAITIPDSVDTRLGTLKFKDGFPDDATVQKVYDNLDSSTACRPSSLRCLPPRWPQCAKDSGLSAPTISP